MRQRRSSSTTLQLSLLLVGILLEITANFAANAADDSAVARAIQSIAAPGLIILLLVLVAGNVVVLWWENPRTKRPEWQSDRSPYPGLAAFAEDDAAVFFGREPQIKELIGRLHESGTDATERFICVTGASGSGKSSLVHAGVVPRLRTSRWSVLPTLVPAGEPLGRLAGLLVTLAGGDQPARLHDLRHDPNAFTHAVRQWRREHGNRYGRVLFVLDQLEELITLSGPADRRLFLDQIARALASDRRLWVLATLRLEFLDDLLAGDHPELFGAPAALGSIGRAEITTVIEEPARLAGMTFDDGLVARIADDTGTPDALPLLAYVLQELYLATRSGKGKSVGRATRETYDALGGVAGALARQADLVLAELRDRYDSDAILSALLRLVAMDGTEPTRRRVPMDELSADERQIVEAFVDARLLTTDATDGKPSVHVAHEALFRQWAPLRQEVRTRAEYLTRRTELERWAADWERAGRSDDYLLTGERLTLAGQWLDAMATAGQDVPGPRALVEASRRRDSAFLRRVSMSVGRYALANVDRYPELAVLLATAALADCARTPIAARALMSALAFSHAESVLSGHADAVRAVAWSPDGTSVATASRDGTARIWDASTGTVSRVLAGHDGMVDGIAWSPNGTLIATGGRDTFVRVWDPATGDQITALNCPDFLRAVAWSPDGRTLAASSRDERVRMWETGSWNLSATLAGHRGDVWGLSWSPDSMRLASASHDRTVIVWDVVAGQPVVILAGHLGFVEAVAFSPDGRWIATGSADESVRIWDAATGAERRSVGGHPDVIWSVAWTPDGTRLVYALGDASVRVWDTIRLCEVGALRGHDQTVWHAAVSPDGTRVLTGSGDTTARIWALQPAGAERTTLVGHTGPVTAVAVDTDGIVITGSDDGSVRHWTPDTPITYPFESPVVTVAASPTASVVAVALQNGTTHLLDIAEGSAHVIADGPEFESLSWSPDGSRLAGGAKDSVIHVLDARDRTSLFSLRGHTDWIGTLAWSPSGRFLASGSDDRTARVWNLEHPDAPIVLTGHQNYVDGLSWAPDEQRLATCSADWTIRLWELPGGESVRTMTGHERRVRAVAWSPDGRRLASASDDRTVRLWDVGSDEPEQIIGVHRDLVSSLAWLPDGDRVVSGSTDATARVWAADVDLDALTRTARKRVFRGLTQEERREHLLPAADE
ncbi:WD40 repeat domain-containing protein [Cryptosporangium aurantiacum]|uniref:WD40 repeat n=1 Tax=Cryptosporangium aurantiacum TaxID=134849 RepID=A0A1M7Q2B4_9ACTN|nr:WD40 repeat domain-containing protein [Cryptosporangium aurantiacum]SHN24403.1 WD40 repeat [Cryptosporangium aurantiacum]